MFKIFNKGKIPIAVYVCLDNGKFWIEEDWIEEGIAMDFGKCNRIGTPVLVKVSNNKFINIPVNKK